MKKLSNKYPSKKYVNLLQQEKNTNTKAVGLLAILLVVLVSVFVKTAVIDRVALYYQTNARIAELNAEIATYRAQNKEYPAIAEEYNHYVFDESYNDVLTVDMEDVFDLLNIHLKDASMVSVSFQNNVINVLMAGIDLEQTSSMVASLVQDEMVETVTVSTAQSEEFKTALVNMTIELKGVEE